MTVTNKQTLNEQLALLRNEITTIYSELKSLEGAPVPEREATARLRSLVGTWKAEADRHIFRQPALRLAAGDHADPLAYFAGDSLGPFFVAMLGDKEVLARLCRDIPSATEGGVSRDERAARIKALTERADVVELEEERVITMLESAGELVQRRADARPEIVLAP